MLLLAARAAHAARPIVIPPEVPPTAAAGDAAVNGSETVPLIAHQTAAAALAAFPVVVLVARLSANSALAAIPVVMRQAMKVHVSPFRSEAHHRVTLPRAARRTSHALPTEISDVVTRNPPPLLIAGGLCPRRTAYQLGQDADCMVHDKGVSRT